jgi:hypothetical protein
VRRLLVLFVLVLLCAPALAAQPLAPGERLEGRFVQERHLKGFAQPLRTEGRFDLVPERGLIWRTETPFATVTVISAAGILQLVEGKETSRIDAARAPFLARLYDLLGGTLGGDWRVLERDFSVSRSGTDERWSVTLLPRNTAEAVAQIGQMTATGGRFVETVEIRRPNGDRERLRFLEQRPVREPLAEEDERLFARLGR